MTALYTGIVAHSHTFYSPHDLSEWGSHWSFHPDKHMENIQLEVEDVLFSGKNNDSSVKTKILLISVCVDLKGPVRLEDAVYRLQSAALN